MNQERLLGELALVVVWGMGIGHGTALGKVSTIVFCIAMGSISVYRLYTFITSSSRP